MFLKNHERSCLNRCLRPGQSDSWSRPRTITLHQSKILDFFERIRTQVDTIFAPRSCIHRYPTLSKIMKKISSKYYPPARWIFLNIQVIIDKKGLRMSGNCCVLVGDSLSSRPFYLIIRRPASTLLVRRAGVGINAEGDWGVFESG